jgi:molybdenum cofactor cytidylyltransferase
MGTAALILAAGESSRFGGFPKAMLPVGRRTAVRRIAEISLEQGLDPVVAVVGAHPGPITHELKDLEVQVVAAENWYEGRTASVQSGLGALPPESDVLFWPVDHPFVRTGTVAGIVSLLSRDLIAAWLIPTYREHGGHPVLWRSGVRAHILELRTDAPLRSLLPEFGPQVRRVPVDDPGVLANADTPEGYRVALEEWEQRGED